MEKMGEEDGAKQAMEVEEEQIKEKNVVEDGGGGGGNKLDNMKELLDEVEDQIEQVRSQAEQIMEEKEDIMNTLEMLGNHSQLEALSEVDREEIQVMVERLNNRLSSVNITLTTPRTSSQQESLHSVNQAIDTLIFQIQTDTTQAKILCSQYLSAAGTEIDHPSDVKFEQHLLGCTAEDQKCVKKRLMGLFDHIKVLAGKTITESE